MPKKSRQVSWEGANSVRLVPRVVEGRGTARGRGSESRAVGRCTAQRQRCLEGPHMTRSPDRTREAAISQELIALVAAGR
jgi:hypothetical protein